MASTNGVKSYKTSDRIYKNFLEILRKNGIEKYGKHATLYMDVFYLKSVTLEKALVVARGLCSAESGAFAIWRDKQVEAGLLLIEQVPIGNGKSTVRYHAGHLALEYINKVSLKYSQIATRSDVDASEDKILAVTADLQRQIDEMKGMLKVVAKAYFDKNPPHSNKRETKLNDNLKNGKAFLDEDLIN